MRTGAADIGKVLDPGPELPSYDPAWEERWDQAHAMLALVGKRDPLGTSELSRVLAEELRDACFARLRFACDLEEHLALESAGPAERAARPLPRILGSATVAEIRMRHAAFRALCERVQAWRAEEPFGDWDTGLFRLEPMQGAVREIRDREVPADWRSDRRTRARLIIERRGSEIDVCVLEHPRADAPMTRAALDILAHLLSDEFLEGRGPRLRRTLRLRRTPRPRLMLHGVFAPFGRFGASRVAEHEIVRDRFGEVSLVETGVVRRATPLMVREMLDMDHELKEALRR